MLTSTKNPKIQMVRKLQKSSRTRREAGAFVVEGVRLVEESHKSIWKLQLVLYTYDISDRGNQLVEAIQAEGIETLPVSNEVMHAASDTETPQGILAVVERLGLTPSEKMDFLIILDAIRDPGNLGTILRTALAVGVDAVLLSPGTVDAFSPKVLRAAMGAHFHLPVHNLHWEEIRMATGGMQVVLTAMEGETIYTEIDYRKPTAIIIGNEADGVGVEAREIASQAVRIPQTKYAESLNAAIACGIMMYEVVRQRGMIDG